MMRAKPEMLLAATLVMATFVVVSTAVAAIVPERSAAPVEISCHF